MIAVHGETVVGPVEPDTNMASLRSDHVDVLAHPGLFTLEEARIVAEKGIFLEVSARKGHSFTNGHVVRTAKAAGVRLLLDSDAHEPGDLLTPEFAKNVALGSGLSEEDANHLLEFAPLDLLKRIGVPYTPSIRASIRDRFPARH